MTAKTTIKIALAACTALFCMSSFAVQPPPVPGPSGGVQSTSEQTIQNIKKRVIQMPTDSTDAEKEGAKDKASYSPMYIVTKIQDYKAPGYFLVGWYDRNGNYVESSSLTGIESCEEGESSNDTVKRIKFGTPYHWFRELKAGGCTSAAICGACISWHDSFTPAGTPGEVGDAAWYNSNPKAQDDLVRGIITQRGVFEGVGYAYYIIPKHNGSGTAKYCGGDSRATFGGLWAYGEVVDKDTPLDNNVKDIVVRRVCYTTEWAKTN